MKDSPDQELRESCKQFLMTKVDNETERLKFEAAETSTQIAELKKSNFEKFWEKIKNQSQPDQVDNAKFAERIKGKFPGRMSKPLQDKLDKMKQQSKREEIQKVFETMPNWAMEQLAND